MSRRSRTSSSVHLHLHCESCFSRRCRAPVEVAVSCAVIPCRLQCGALFHLCKGEEHSLLCPNERVPCLNLAYGCPIIMPRSRLADHLRVCPASVVCCSMEWNRWPTEDAQAHTHTVLHENLLRREKAEQEEEALDLAMALGDQDHLFHSLKMKKLFPELTEREEKEEEETEGEEAALQKVVAEGATAGGVSLGDRVNYTSGSAEASWSSPMGVPEDVEWEEAEELTQEEREALARSSGVDSQLLENYRAWERMFNMERGGCTQAGKGAGTGKGGGHGSGFIKGPSLNTLVEEGTETQTLLYTEPHTYSDSYAQHPDSPCLSSSSRRLAKDARSTFVYGSVEPMKITTVRSTFKVPTSFTAKHASVRNPHHHHKRKECGVDTSDLGVGLDNMPCWEEVQATLLCSLEKELRGHLIAESQCVDALKQDSGTQTYHFLSAPFGCEMSLADITADKPLELRLQLQTESVTSRHNKASSAFTFLCGHSFLRREFPTHFRNVHADIQTGLSGWFEQRCPLAYLGCTYSQRRFQPSTHNATVTYNQELSSFSLRPTIPASPSEGSQQPPLNPAELTSTPRKMGARAGGTEDSLSALPYEVLCHMAGFLDSLSLSQLALASCLLRDVCSSLLQERGMVTLHWEKKTDSHGGAKWGIEKKVWQFSTLFSIVDKWHFQDVASISEHLKACPYYETESRTERFLLPPMRDGTHMNTYSKGHSLVNMFQKKKTII